MYKKSIRQKKGERGYDKRGKQTILDTEKGTKRKIERKRDSLRYREMVLRVRQRGKETVLDTEKGTKRKIERQRDSLRYRERD